METYVKSLNSVFLPRMRTATLMTALCLFMLAAGAANAVTYTDSAAQTTAGQNFVFTFFGVEPWNSGDGTLTIHARGDYSVKYPSEHLSWGIEGLASDIGAPAYGTVIYEFSHDDVEWEQSYTINSSIMNAITSDSVIYISVDLESNVDIIGINSFVEVELTYNSSGPPCPPPPEPNDPEPFDGAENVPIDTCLAWNGSVTDTASAGDAQIDIDRTLEDDESHSSEALSGQIDITTGVTSYDEADNIVPEEKSYLTGSTNADNGLDEQGNPQLAAIVDMNNHVWLNSMGDVINSFSSPGTYPAGLTWKNGTLYHVDKNAGKVYQLDPTNGAVLSSIGPFSGAPFLAGLTWDGTYFWCTDPQADTIFKFNTAGTIIHTFPAPSNIPVGITWDGYSLWVCDSSTDKIYEIDPSNGSVRSSIPAPDTRVAGMGFDGTALWTNGRDSAKTYRISRTDGSVLASFPTPPGHGVNNGFGCTFDGQYLWVANWDVKMIYQIDIDFVPAVICDVHFDVYLGTDPLAMELVCNNLDEPNYCPGVLETGETYYWQVIAKNPSGETPGNVWSFRTEGGNPPECDNAVPSVAEIWPPRHEWVDIEILDVTDPDGDPVTITITGITQDEPVAGPGSGRTSPDGMGVGTSVAHIRAERTGQSDNCRVYEISFEADDGMGNTCNGSVNVYVPHDQGKKHVCVDDGQLYDSTATEMFKADLNGDGIIDLLDFNILANYWLVSYELED